MGEPNEHDRLFNGRVLLEFAAKEVTGARPVDADELGAAIHATGDVLDALREASKALGIDPPELPELETWMRQVVEHTPGPPRHKHLRLL